MLETAGATSSDPRVAAFAARVVSLYEHERNANQEDGQPPLASGERLSVYIYRVALGAPQIGVVVAADIFIHVDLAINLVQERPRALEILGMDSQDVSAFCFDLLEEKGVMLLPGGIFDYEGNHFRVGFGRRNMPEALTRVKEWLNEKGI